MLPSTHLHSKLMRCLPILLTALIFAGCGTPSTPDQSAAYLQGTNQADSRYYLQQMAQSSDDSKTNWQLLAIRALLQEGKTQQASELFDQLSMDLTEAQDRELSLLAVEGKLAQNNLPGAQALLEKINPGQFNRYQQMRYWQAQIAAGQEKPSLELLRALIAQQSLLKEPEQQQQNIDAIWKALTAMSKEQANALVINADENILQGWLDLQRSWLDNRQDPAQLETAVKEWQIRYPQNPGAKMLPTALMNKTAHQYQEPASTTKIALLLPLNGQAAIFGQTIQQGFISAQNGAPLPANTPPEQLAQMATLNPDDTASAQPTTSGEVTSDDPAPAANTDAPPPPQAAVAPVASPAVNLQIYDTTTQPMNQLLNQVQQDGATIVVGPLLKEDVESVINSNTTLNVLALNQPENIVNRANICYFSLSPEDEARDAARHIHAQGKQAPLLLAPDGKLGDRVVSAFASEWAKLTSSTVLQQRFGSVTDLKSSVSSGISLTGVPVSSSSSLQEPTDNSTDKIDAVWVLATPEQIAYIKPMIALRSGSQSGVTLYTSSRSAQGNPGTDFRLEMEGLQYSEIPLLAGRNPALMEQALAAVHDDYSLARLYAMGADAWSLVNHFTQLRQNPDMTINGNTGDLTTTPDCVINRNLSWLKYQNGQIVAAN